MAANHGAANTSNSDSLSSQGPRVLCSSRYCTTRSGDWPRWGKIEPGTEASATRKSRISAVRMDVSCRHPQRSHPVRPI